MIEKQGDDKVGLAEFRLFLVFMRQFFEYWEMFEQLDRDGDLNIDIEQFKKAAPLLKKWNVDVTDHPEETFKAIANESGKLNYDEFCAYAAAHNRDLKCDIDWTALSAKLPTSKSEDAKAERKKLFEDMNTSGSGCLSLTEAKEGVRNVLQCHVSEAGHVVERAYNAAKSFNPTIKKDGDL